MVLEGGGMMQAREAVQEAVWPIWMLAAGLGLLGTACGLLLLSAAMLIMRI